MSACCTQLKSQQATASQDHVGPMCKFTESQIQCNILLRIYSAAVQKVNLFSKHMFEALYYR